MKRLLLLFPLVISAQVQTIPNTTFPAVRALLNSNFSWLNVNKAGNSACAANKYAIQTTTAGVVCASLTSLQVTAALGFTPQTPISGAPGSWPSTFPPQTPGVSTLGGIKSGQCTTTTGKLMGYDTSGNPICESDQTGAPGAGITSLGGLLGSTQDWGNDTNVTMTPTGSTHQLGWTGLLAVARGGTGASSALQNQVFAGPSSGSGAPLFRLLSVGDIPSLSSIYAALIHTHPGVYEPANANIQAHVTSTANPHSTTAAQVGAQALSGKDANGGYVGRDGSGNSAITGTMTASGFGTSYTGVAQAMEIKQGTAPPAPAANSFQLRAPTSIPAAYFWTVPSADASGCLQSNGSGVLSIAACGSGGTSVSVNGSLVSSPNFNGTTPVAETGYKNAKLQVSGSSISVEVAYPTVAELPGEFYALSTGSANAYVVAPTSTVASYITGENYYFKSSFANTGAATVNFSGLGAKTIKKPQGGITTDLAANDIRSGQMVALMYDGTNMQMTSQLGNAAGGATVASTTSALKGDGAGNAVAVTGTGSNCVHVDGSSAACAGGATIASTTALLKGDGAGNASATDLTGDVTTGGAQATTLAARYKIWSCQPGIGDGLNAITAGTYLQSICYNDTGATVTLSGIKCYSDNSGTSTMAVTNGAGTALLTGAVTCSSSFAAGTQSGTTTIASGDYLKFSFVADGTSKQSTWVITGSR